MPCYGFRMAEDEEERQQIYVEVPKSWVPELKAAADRRFMSRNGFICSALRRVLDGEKDKHSKRTPQSRHATASTEEPCSHPVSRRIGKGCGACGKDPVK